MTTMISARRAVLLLTVTAALGVCGAARAAELAAKPSRTFERPEGDVLAIAYTADGKYLCAGGDRGVVYCWDVYTGDIVNRPTAHLRAAVFAVATYPLAPVAAHASELGIKFHLVGARGKVPTFPFKHMQTVLTLDFSRDGDHMASADRGGEIIVWDLWAGNPYRRFQAGKAPVNGVRFHPDGNLLAAASDDGKLTVWDTKADKMRYEIAAHEGACNSVAFNADGRFMATAGKDKKIKLWNPSDGKLIAALEGHEDAVNAVAFHPKGTPLLASGADDKSVRLWDTARRKPLQTVPHEKPVYSLAWRPDGAVLATASGKLVQLFDVK